MRALAEYVMKGRFQAVVAAVFATGTVFFAWVGAAVIALVTLRRGFSDGAYVLFWALLPASLLTYWGDIGPLVTVVGAMLVAVALRATASWSWALTIAVASGLLTSVLLMVFGQAYLEQIVNVFSQTLTQVASESQNPDIKMFPVPSKPLIAGFLGLSNTFTVSICLVLARWWQAQLYNPGGFQAEFHQLRLAPQLTLLLVVAGAALTALGPDYRFWPLIFAVPLVFAGFALVHAVVAIKNVSSNWLVAFYLGWVILDPLKVLLLVVAVADSWLDIRRRVADS